ncbi:RMS1 [Cyberlindnera jadinii]|uniref:Ribosomal lysine N-methyltransferase 4 n=1 Tax=Cyberlindnera jadinii (strain ATCC 18201 / CBS 1600 / BCRC 20928 / JCM 3617 / NBRC 0987 / NRRL Y-1542) TaxID=983966 RepID=A0A0H5BY37_CYBJN|nr:RMS1 [Cyberlindnera jadinii]
MDPFQAATSQFQQWLLHCGYRVSPKVDIADLRHLSQGRGLVATDYIKQGEVLFAIPRNVLLNIDTGSLSSIGDNKEKLLTKYDHWEGLILTILFELSLGEQSKWAPYFKVLPTEFHNLMFWSDEELKSLEPSLVLGRVGKSKAEESYHKLIPSALEDLGIGNLQVSLQLFHQVASSIMSYSFDVERPDFDEDQEDDEQVKYDGYFKSLVALADTLNADTNQVNANLFYEPDFLTMKAVKPIAKGEQIYNTYGDHPNSELLRRYGYVEYNGSKYDFGEVPLEIIHETVVNHYNLKPEFLDLVFKLISESDVDELEEDIVLDAFDSYIDGAVLPESQVLIQVLTVIGEIASQEHLQDLSPELLSKTLNRILKKCYQLIETGSITKNAVMLWEQCIINRLSQYPSHAFRDFIIPEPSQYLNKVKMGECILKSEVCSLQNSIEGFSKELKIINDDKLIRNILKRKAQHDDTRHDFKRQKH